LPRFSTAYVESPNFVPLLYCRLGFAAFFRLAIQAHRGNYGGREGLSKALEEVPQ
jgi:hypothetical protein